MEGNTQNTPEVHNHVSDRNANNTVSFLALAVAAAALVLAWVVYHNQPGQDFKDTVRTEKNEMDKKMDSAAEKTQDTTRDAAGAIVEKTGQVMQATGEATQQVGTDIKSDDQAMPR